MKSLLPASLNGDNNEESILSSYNSWLENHPSALENFEKVMNIAREKKIVVFLDYDGTLSQIVDDPDKAYMTDAVSTLQINISDFVISKYFLGHLYGKQLRNILYYVYLIFIIGSINFTIQSNEI